MDGRHRVYEVQRVNALHIIERSRSKKIKHCCGSEIHLWSKEHGSNRLSFLKGVIYMGLLQTVYKSKNRYHAILILWRRNICLVFGLTFFFVISFRYCLCLQQARWRMNSAHEPKTHVLNEPTPAHRDCIPNRSYRLVPQRTEHPTSCATQTSPHFLHSPRPRRIIHAGTGTSYDGSHRRSRSHCR